VRHEELAAGLLDAGRDDEERVHAGDLAQVLLRDLRHAARDLLQRGHQVLGSAGDERGAAVGRVLPVARDHHDQHPADHVGQKRNGEHDQPDGRTGVPVAVAAAEHPAPQPEARKRGRPPKERES